MRALTTIALISASLVVFSGCAAEPDEPKQQSTATSTAAAPSTEPVTLTATVGLHEIEYTVGPLVNHGELSILPIEALSLTPAGDDPVWLGEMWGSVLQIGAKGVRLLDGTNRTVEDAALRSAQKSSASLYSGGYLEVGDTEPQHAFVIYGARTTSTVDVIIPVAGLAADVPVVAMADLSTADAASLTESFDKLLGKGTPSAVVPQLWPLESFSVSLDESSDTRIVEDKVVVNIDTSVLFAADDSTIAADADATLLAATAQFAGYPAGTLSIVGHTSTGGDETPAYNNDLSLRRAQAVHDRLAALQDLTKYEITVEGRGLTVPRVDGSSEAARAQNRRVELVFVPDATATASVKQATKFTLPDSNGPTAAGPEGVTLEGKDPTQQRLNTSTQANVTLENVSRRGSVLVGTVRIEHVAGEETRIGEWFNSTGQNARGFTQLNLPFSPNNLTLLAGTQRVYPLDYSRSSGSTSRMPMTELNLNMPLVPGGAIMITVVWPDISGGEASTVVLDHEDRRPEQTYQEIHPPFRLNKIPVVEE